MGWHLVGQREQLVIAGSGNGLLSAHGTCRHEIEPASTAAPGVTRALPIIRQATCHWGLYRAENRDWEEIIQLYELLANSSGYVAKVDEALRTKKSTAAVLKYHAEAPMSVNMTFIAPSAAFDEILGLLLMVMTRDDLEYHFGLKFLGFPVPGAAVEFPTIDEWMRLSRAYFTTVETTTVRVRSTKSR